MTELDSGEYFVQANLPIQPLLVRVDSGPGTLVASDVWNPAVAFSPSSFSAADLQAMLANLDVKSLDGSTAAVTNLVNQVNGSWDAAITVLIAAINAAGINLTQINGNAAAATALASQVTSPITGAIDQISAGVWANQTRTMTAFPFNVSLAATGLDAVMVENGVSLPHAVGAIHAEAVGVVTGDGAKTGTGNFTVTVGSTVRMTGTMLDDTRTSVAVTYFGTTTPILTTIGITTP